MSAMGEVLIELLEAKAAELRKSNPNLTKEQAFAKVYADPENRELAKAERATNGFRNVLPPLARTEPITTRFDEADALAALKKLAAEFRERHPFMTPEQAFTKVYSDPANRELVRRERAQNRPAA